MTLVMVSRKEAKLHNALLRPIIKKLPVVIAEVLSVSGTSELAAKDITVWTRDVRNDDLDVTQDFDVQVIIFANDHPKRAEHIADRRIIIANWLKDQCPKGTKGYVGIVLQEPVSFGTFCSK